MMRYSGMDAFRIRSRNEGQRMFEHLGLSPRTGRLARRGFIFDFDGTIADSMNVWNWVDREFLARRNITPPSDYGKKLSTLGFVQGAAYVIQAFNLDESPESIMDEWNALALEQYATSVYLKPSARHYIEQVRTLEDTKIAIATTLDPPLLAAALENNDATDLFDAFAHGCEVASDKHQPDIYLLAARRLEISPTECVVFEDILPGIVSAKRAGMLAIGVRDDSGHQEVDALREHADGLVDSFEQLCR